MSSDQSCLRAVGYFRVSTREQADERRVSLPVQEERFLATCREQRWEPIGSYVDAQTGRNDRRTNYQKMLAALRERKADVVVVQFLDRFGRNPREILRRFWELEEIGVKIHVTDEDVREELILLIRAAMAGKESERISQRVIPTMARVVSEGRWASRPSYGYRLIQDPQSPARGKLVVDEVQAAVVRRIFRTYAAGILGFGTIAGELNSEGIAAPRGSTWWSGTIQTVLENPCYIGRLTWKGEHVPGGCPRIIDDTTWDRVADILLRRKHSVVRLPPSNGFLLAGMVRCACGYFRSCWTSFHRRADGSRYREIRYYRCSRNSHTRLCRSGLIKAQTLEDWVKQQLSDWRPPEVRHARDAPLDDGQRDRERDRHAIRQRVTLYETRISRLLDMLMDRTITRDEYHAKRLEYSSAIARAHAELAALAEPTEPVRLEHFEQWLAQVQTIMAVAPDAELRALLMEVIDHVQVVDRDTWQIVLKSDFGMVGGM